MDDGALVLIEIGALIFGIGLLARLAARLGISPIPLILIGGLAFGQGGLLPITQGGDFIEIGAEIGVILLLLLLGIEYSPAELIGSLRRSRTAALIDMLLNALPGALVALLLGWGPVGAMALAGITWVTSSGVVAKMLHDLGRLTNRETPIVLSILVIEDLAMAFYLPILTALLVRMDLGGGTLSVLIALAVVSVILYIALRHSRTVSRLVWSRSAEVLLFSVLGLALLVSGLAVQAHVSAAVGAFLVGIAISGPVAAHAQRVLTPLRDLFASVFFLFFGLSTDPRDLRPDAHPCSGPGPRDHRARRSSRATSPRGVRGSGRRVGGVPALRSPRAGSSRSSSRASRSPGDSIVRSPLSRPRTCSSRSSSDRSCHGSPTRVGSPGGRSGSRPTVVPGSLPRPLRDHAPSCAALSAQPVTAAPACGSLSRSAGDRRAGRSAAGRAAPAPRHVGRTVGTMDLDFGALSRHPDVEAPELHAADAADRLLLDEAADALAAAAAGTVVVIGDATGRSPSEPPSGTGCAASGCIRTACRASARSPPTPSGSASSATWEHHDLDADLTSGAEVVLLRLPRSLDALSEIADDHRPARRAGRAGVRRRAWSSTWRCR